MDFLIWSCSYTVLHNVYHCINNLGWPTTDLWSVLDTTRRLLVVQYFYTLVIWYRLFVITLERAHFFLSQCVSSEVDAQCFVLSTSFPLPHPLCTPFLPPCELTFRHFLTSNVAIDINHHQPPPKPLWLTNHIPCHLLQFQTRSSHVTWCLYHTLIG